MAMEIILEVTRALCPLCATADAHRENEREEKCVAFGLWTDPGSAGMEQETERKHKLT